MRLNTLALPTAEWACHSHPGAHRLLEANATGLIEATGTHQVIDMESRQSLTEATYKEIASLLDGNFLNQKVRADALDGIEIGRFDATGISFNINSSEFHKNQLIYPVSVWFDEWDETGQDVSLTHMEKARLLLWVGNVRFHCACPSFKYHGYQYLLTQLDAAIEPEQRSPDRQNPDQRGICCKHIARILRVLPFYSADIAGELKRQFGGADAGGEELGEIPG